ncbi:MAG TPA: hypothetical protein VFM19_03290 [Candidatus Limnocylindria bacterium]|nr:hypothetical protein [Candidatus Limnocylindria bacterium]
MSTAPLLAAGAAMLAGAATLVAQIDGDTDIVPFFVGLLVAAVGESALLTAPSLRWRRVAAWVIAGLWLVAAVWIGGLLVIYQTACGCSRPFPLEPERTYLGLTATVYHLAGLYGGLVLVWAAAWRASRAARPG